MPARPEVAPQPAPEDFWDELREHHDKLWTDGQVRHRTRGLTMYARDLWAHKEVSEDRTLLSIAVRWQAEKHVGRTALATLNVSIMRLQDVLDLAGLNDVTQSDAPVENVRAAYALPARHSKEQPVLVTHTNMYIPRDVATSPPRPQEDMVMTQLEQARQGLITPDSPNFDRVLVEMAIGASGQHRVLRDKW